MKLNGVECLKLVGVVGVVFEGCMVGWVVVVWFGFG